MRFITKLWKSRPLLVLSTGLACVFYASVVTGQQMQDKPVTPAADRNRLYCAGHIRYERFSASPEIVGTEEEQEKRVFAAGDIVYMNAGTQQGIRSGHEFMILRPRGEPKQVHTQKSGFLGIYVEEVGQLEVLKALDTTSVAQITYSCDTVLLGDLLTPVPERVSPVAPADLPVDRFADPSGKQIGRVMMARDGREMVTRNDIVYIDLGAEDNLAVGNYLTIFREVGTGNITRIDFPELARTRSWGFQSQRFRGGGFGIQAQRSKETSAGLYRGRPITSREIQNKRPPMPRKIVGEMVILNVQRRTATALITRVAQEVHTGDFVEVR